MDIPVLPRRHLDSPRQNLSEESVRELVRDVVCVDGLYG